MASILDQYEYAQAARVPVSRTIQEPVLSGSGFIDARPKEEKQIFSKNKIDFSPKSSVTHIAECNGFLVMALSNGIINRLDLSHPSDLEELEIFKGTEDKVSKIFMDPTGRHLIISMKSQENYYLSRNSKKPKSISKLKNHSITCVGWNWQKTNENTTGAILLGTAQGEVFETELSANDDSRFFQSALDQYLKQLYHIKAEGQSPEPVTGIEFDRVTSESMTDYQYFILITTPGKLFQFLGTISKTAEAPIFAHIFQKFESSDQTASYHQLPGEFGHSELRLFHNNPREPANKFAWMAGPGVYYGDIDLSGRLGPHQVLSNPMLLRYPKNEEGSTEKPLSMVMTQFHVLLLYPDRVKAFCLLNEQLILDDPFQDLYGRLVGIVKDPMRGTIRLHTSQYIFKYIVHNETRDVWQMYMDKGEFELAKVYCKDNPMQVNTVLTHQAEFLFKEKRYLESAEMYAKTQCSFEEVALRFIRLEDKNALRKFLRTKLDSLRSQDKTQMTMLVTWLIEIYLNQLGELREQSQEGTPYYKTLQNEFQDFLRLVRIKECVSHNRAVVYDLIASHGDVLDLIFFAMLMQDYEKVISHHLQYDDYKAALNKLTKQNDPELYYKFSPIFMQYIPHETVEAWKSQKSLLDPKRLIPALVQYDDVRFSDQANSVINYLEFCINTLRNQDQAIHNYLVALYAKLKPGRLMDYFTSQKKEDMYDDDDLCYDLKYALRLCSEHGHKKECVYIYSQMGLYEEAVDLALTINVELAKEEASKPDNEDVELRKKLWLKIAQHVVQEEKNVKKAMEFLHECDLLKIEDILPFFPDFVTIDHFKDAIIDSLEAYNKHIDQLKEEMAEATSSAEEIRREITGFRNKYAQVKAQDKCFKCNFPLMTRAFYLFPCQHKFHSDCLIEEILPNLTSKSRDKVQELQSRLAERDENKPTKQDAAVTSSKQKLKMDLDDLVASECIYCGKFMIMSIDKPFFDGTDEEEQGWL